MSRAVLAVRVSPLLSLRRERAAGTAYRTTSCGLAGYAETMMVWRLRERNWHRVLNLGDGCGFVSAIIPAFVASPPFLGLGDG